MKIEKLHIYGFGKHENVQIELQAGLNIFYGENEAGKSSIQQFILHILFGFPQRNTPLLRYEPKNGAIYGGKIHLLVEQRGRVVIERVKGKASGEVTVFFEDGSQGGEAELANLLHAYTRSDFEAIFSFSLLQLQGFEKMSEEELTRTLLASGTTGVDTLTKVESQFVKEMGELFKPSGKKPLINQKIEEIKILEAEWKQQIEEVNKYEPSVKRLKEIETSLEETTKRENEVKVELKRYVEWKQLKPLREKQLELEHALKDIKNLSFPADGIRRYENIKDKILNLKITSDQLVESLNKMSSSKGTLSAEQLKKLHSFLAYETEWHQLRAKRIQIEEEQSKTLQNQMQQLALVGVDSESAIKKIVEADLSIQQEEKLVLLLKEREQIEHNTIQEQRLLQLKSEELREKQKRAEEMKGNNKDSIGNKVSLVFSGIILFLGILLSFLLSNWLIGLAGVLMSVIAYIGFSYVQGAANKGNNVKAYEKMLRAEEETVRQQVTNLENSIVTLNNQKLKLEQKVYEFLTKYNISDQLSSSLLKEVFKRLRMIQEHQIRLEQLEINLYETERRMEEILGQTKEFTTTTLPRDLLFHQLREYYLAEKKKLEESEALQDHVKEISTKLEDTNALRHAYEQNIKELLHEANVEKEEDYYTSHHLFEQKVSLEKELHQLVSQLGGKEISLEDFDELFEEANSKELEILQKNRNELLEEKATLQYQTKRLLEDVQQSELYQKLEQKKAELQDYVKKWASYKAVVEAIRQMMVQLKEERLPEVLEDAQEIFKWLTGMKYDHLQFTSEGIFEAIRVDGQRFNIAELSQATKEQAYISLRIALAKSLKSRAPFPIVMDDPFVHFDRFRLQQVVQLMKELQKEHQLLYFTCHENMQNHWQDANVIQVASLLAGSGGMVK